MKKFLIIAISLIIVVVLVLGGFFVCNYHWKTYTNARYGFKIKYPQGWGVKDELWRPGNIDIPQITIQKIGENSYEGSSILIYPEGFPFSDSDNVNVEIQKIYLGGKKATVEKFLTVSGDVLEEHIYEILDLPNSWGEFAYILLRSKVDNFRTECVTQVSSEEECGYGDGRRMFGDIDRNEYKILQDILSTFKFTK